MGFDDGNFQEAPDKAEYEAWEKVHQYGDSHPESCITSHYSIKDRLIDVRLDRKPLMANATWCSRHDQWSSSCAYQWQVRALKAEALLRKITVAKIECPELRALIRELLESI